MILRTRLSPLVVLVVLLVAMGGLPRAKATLSPTFIYFDQTEEQDFWSTAMPPYAGLPTRQIVKPWDPNGQMCLFPDGSGRFTVAYNPTGVEQKGPDLRSKNAGGLMPRKQPPVGVAIYKPNGTFTGRTMYVPGPYKLTPKSSQWTKYGVVGPDVGGDIPPDSANGAFNNNGTYTGCVFGKHGNFFAVDLGTAQGAYPPPDDGRLIEWFAQGGYKSVCIIYGPTTGGDKGTTHHVDGHGGLQQPGLMASDQAGNIYVPVDAADPQTLLPQGKVLKFNANMLPRSPKDCPTTRPGIANGNQTSYHVVSPTTFINGTTSLMPFPAAIAWDPACRCWAVSNVFFGPFAVLWFDTSGSPLDQTAHVPILANYGGQFSPFGMAFDRSGDLFVVDIHVQVDAVGSIRSQSLQAGPIDGQGRLLEFTFNGPVPSLPKVIASGESFPVAVTACDPTNYRQCPRPSR